MNVKLMIASLMLAACAHASPAQTTKINGIELDYLVRGEGPPLYLLHGGMESRDSFENQIPVFARHFTIVALDSRKQGRSGASDEPISYQLMSEDVLALAEHLNHEKIAIVGLSDGGITALTTAFHHPDRVDKMVVLGATFHYEAYPKSVREFIANYEWDGDETRTGYPGIFIDHYLKGHDDLSGFGSLLAEMSKMWTTSPRFETSDLAQITPETLVINGDHEDVPIGHALDLYENLPNAQLFIVPDATHYALYEKPELLNNVILDFLLSEED